MGDGGFLTSLYNLKEPFKVQQAPVLDLYNHLLICQNNQEEIFAPIPSPVPPASGEGEHNTKSPKPGVNDSWQGQHGSPALPVITFPLPLLVMRCKERTAQPIKLLRQLLLGHFLDKAGVIIDAPSAGIANNQGVGENRS